MDASSTIQSVHREPRSLRVHWLDGHISTFHFIWLRDNCACPSCGDHSSGVRLKALLDIPDDISPADIEVVGPALDVTWADDRHASSYQARWLRQHCYSDAARTNRRRNKTLWNSSLSPVPTIDYCEARDNPTARRKLYAAVAEYGFVVLYNVGVSYDEIERLTTMLGYVRNTHFGHVTDLKPRDQFAHLSDLTTNILPHSDETYRPVPTGINVFHCLVPGIDGGTSILVDAHRCAVELRRDHPAAFELLSTVPLRHERRTDGETIYSNVPAFTLDNEGEIAEVRLNERTMCAISVPAALMESVYRSLRTVLRIAYDPTNQITHRLEAGQALVFDNMRVLHGRTTFQGPRLLRQSNVIRDEFYARLACLES
jgi:alpha-ketoglutarate-dependent taurine dioxygenase